MLFKKGIFGILLGCCMNLAFASDYHYEKVTFENQVIHKVTVDPNAHRVKLIKANQGKVGRETVSAMAKKEHATIALNGGFFEIGGERDGFPSGTLVIDGHVYGIKNRIEPLLIIDNNAVSIVDKNPKRVLSKTISMLSGIPLLLKNSEIPKSVLQKKTSFYTEKHARTAIGIKPNGHLVILVVENHYLKDLSTISAGEIQSLIQKKGKALAQKYNHKHPEEITLKELKAILKEEFRPQNSVEGLSLVALATLMQKEGCKTAINLDGGGSSTLWINGKVVNQTIGDSDESAALHIERPVSDAIVFIKK